MARMTAEMHQMNPKTAPHLGAPLASSSVTTPTAFSPHKSVTEMMIVVMALMRNNVMITPVLVNNLNAPAAPMRTMEI